MTKNGVLHPSCQGCGRGEIAGHADWCPGIAGPCRNCSSVSVEDAGHVYEQRVCCPDCDHRPRVSPAPELSDAEFSRLRAIEIAPDAPESVRARLINALRVADLNGSAIIGMDTSEWDAGYERMADAAIAVLRGEPYPPQR